MRHNLLFLLLICCLVLSGCGTDDSVKNNTIEETSSQSILDKIGYKPVYDTEEDTPSPESNISSDVDVDLTTLSPTMVFAEVYNMMATPDDYVGKTVKISGKYYSVNDKKTGKTYFYVIIKDATACCEQGMEFIWDNGTHVYPDEYPEEEKEITITGIFNYYTEDGLNFCYLDIDTL